MSQKQIYIPQDKQKMVDDLMELLEKKDKSFSGWIMEQAQAYVQANKPADPEEVKKPKELCHRPRNLGKNCELENCPLIDPSLGHVGRERQFADRKSCIFRQVVAEM